MKKEKKNRHSIFESFFEEDNLLVLGMYYAMMNNH